MDALIKLANILADQTLPPVLPIPGRIAYVVSHAQSYASHGYAVRTQGIARSLNEHGFETLCFVRPGRPWALVAGKSGGVVLRGEVDGVRHIHSRWPDGPPATEEAHLERSVECFTELFQLYRPECVLAASNWIVGLPAWVAARRLGLPFFNEVRGFWELSQDAREPGYAASLAGRAEAERDLFVALQATKVFTLNQPMAQELIRRGVESARIALVPNGVSTLPEIRPADPALKARLGIQTGDKVVGYVGSFNPYEGLDTLTEACRQLAAKGEPIKLLLVGDNQPVPGMSGGKPQADAPWLIRVGRVPHEQVGEYYALMDVVVIPRKKIRVCELVPPMKAVEALAYGKRLLASDLPALRALYPAGEGIEYVPAQSVDAWVRKISTALGASNTPSSSRESWLLSRFIQPAMLTTSLPDSLDAEIGLVQKRGKRDDTIEGDIRLSATVCWRRFPVNGARTIRVLGCVQVRDGSHKSAILLLKAFDRHGHVIPADKIPLPKSDLFGCNFRYLHDSGGQQASLAGFDAAQDIAFIDIGLCLFEAESNVSVTVSDLDVESRALPVAVGRDGTVVNTVTPRLRAPEEFRVAMLADEFTANSFAQEFQAFHVTPDNWKAIFAEHRPDIFFCESAWSGVDSGRRPWKGRIYASVNFPRENRTELLAILEYCRQHRIPTVFWNKEDPTHHDDRIHDFVKTAKEFDYVFTTAEECVESYRKHHQIKNVFALPFATNPHLFNPLETQIRSRKIVFAGSWYANHVERSQDMERILDQLIMDGFEMEIYDRYYGEKDESHQWPEKYRKYLRPAKPHHEMPAVYKSSMFGLNFNTVTTSPTMFARRVFELMSCNTLVLSNDAEGTRKMFGDLVIYPAQEPGRLKALTSEDINALRNRALHEVLEKHTYRERWKTILRAIGLPFHDNPVTLTFVSMIGSRRDATAAISWFQQYGTRFGDARLLLVVRSNVDNPVVASIYQEFNRFGVAVTASSYAEKYAIHGRYHPVETSHFCVLNGADSALADRIRDAILHLQYMRDYPLALESCFDRRYRLAEVNADTTLLDVSERFVMWLRNASASRKMNAYLV